LEELQTVDGVGVVTPVALRIIRESATLYLTADRRTEGTALRSRRDCPILALENWVATVRGVRSRLPGPVSSFTEGRRGETRGRND
jgi:hypothetical protein